MIPRKVWEVCPFCGKSIRVPSNKIGTCDRCGHEITPCSACLESDCSRCRFRKERKHTDMSYYLLNHQNA